MTPQRKALTLVVFWCVVLCAAWVMPWGYSGGDQAAAASSPPMEEATTEQASPITSPEPTESAVPSPTPEPSTSPVRPTSRPADGKKGSVAPLAATLSTSIGASPAAIEVGQQTSITVSLTNGGDAPATNAGMTISVPNGLAVSSATPDPDQLDTDPGGVSINYEFGTLEPGGTRAATVVGIGEKASSAPVVIEVAGRADGLNSFSQTQVVVTEVPGAEVRISDPRGPTFAKVGDGVGYSLKLRNPGNTPVTDLAIVYLVPSEISVSRAGLPNGVDAVQIGVFKGKEDVVWVVDRLAPGRTLTLSWAGRVTTAGDLDARATARAEVAGKVVDRGGSSTYLADTAGTTARNPGFEPVVRRVVTTETVVVGPSGRVPTGLGTGAGASELPFTGGARSGILLVAVSLLVSGTFLVVLASRRLRGRRMLVGCVALLVVATACTGSEEAPPDRVKGETITRDEPEEGADAPGPNDAGEDDVLDEPAEEPGDTGDDVGDTDDLVSGAPDDPGASDEGEIAAPGPGSPPVGPQTRVVRRVRTRTIEADDLRIQASPSLVAPATSISRDGSDAGGGSSSTGSGAALLTSDVRAQGDRLIGAVTLVNRSATKRLQVDGNLLFRVAGFGTLRSSGLHRLLNPGGHVTVRFEFKLPGGSFEAQPSFSSS